MSDIDTPSFLSTADLPPLPSLGSGLGSSLGPGGRYTGSSTADALIDPFTAPAPRLRRRASRTGGFGMDTEEPVQHGSMTSRRPGSGGMQSSSSLGPLPSLSELPTFSTSSSLASSSLGGALSSPSGDNYPSIGGEGELGPSHASRHLRKPARRATFSQAQLNIMEDLWSQTEYPSNDQIEACASATGLVSS